MMLGFDKKVFSLSLSMWIYFMYPVCIDCLSVCPYVNTVTKHVLYKS